VRESDVRPASFADGPDDMFRRDERAGAVDEERHFNPGANIHVAVARQLRAGNRHHGMLQSNDRLDVGTLDGTARGTAAQKQ